MRTKIILLLVSCSVTSLFGQPNKMNYSQKICFSNLNGKIYFDSLDNSVTTQVFLASSLNVKFKTVASSKQTSLLLSNSQNSSTGTWLSPADTFLYRLTTKFVISGGFFKVASRKVEYTDFTFSIHSNDNISLHFLLQDSTEFDEERRAHDPTLFQFIPDNHLISKVIYKDLDNDGKVEILLVSRSVYFGSIDRAAESAGLEECEIKILKLINGLYESVFTYSPEAILQYVNFIKLNGHSNFSIFIGSANCWRDCYTKLEILSIGNGTLENCMQDLDY